MAMIINHAVHAGAFSLYTEASPAAIGNFAAGIAAEGADASIGWYNPAGLVLLKHQEAQLGVVGVFPYSTLSGVSSYYTNVPGSGGSIASYVQPFTGISGAESAAVPSFHYALPLNDTVTFGLSIVSPFGLSTDYGTTSAVRYSGTRSQLETIDVSPEVGWLLNNNISFGIGLDLQYARVKFNRVIGSPALMVDVLEAPPTTIDSQTLNSGESYTTGFHTGVLLMFNDRHTRLGLNYQSQMTHKFQGYSLLVGRLADPTLNVLGDPTEADPNASYRSNHLYSNNISLPNIVTLSGYQDLDAKWALLGSVVYSSWSPFKSISLNNIAVGLPNPDESGFIIQTTANANTPQNYRDVWRFSVGVNYHVNERLMMRVGGGYDETPTVVSDRDVRLPDTDRWAASIGAHYQFRPSVGFDVGYTYLFGSTDSIINNTSVISSASSVNVNARGKNYAQLVGLQAIWTIDAT